MDDMRHKYEVLSLRHLAKNYLYKTKSCWISDYFAPTIAPTNTFASSAFRL